MVDGSDATGKSYYTGSVPSSVILRRLELHELIRAALWKGWVQLRREDFKSTSTGCLDVPHFGYVYAVLVSLSAADWKRECDRVLLRGEARSLLTHEELDWGYFAMLEDVRELADYLVHTEQGAKPLTAVYIGRECHGETSKTRTDRVFAHGVAGKSSGSNSNVRELLSFTNRKPDATLQMPLGQAQVERVILAFMPADVDDVELMEAAVGALVFGSGAVVMNNSPTGEGSVRYTAEGHDGRPPRLVTDAEDWITSVGGIAKAARYAVELCHNAFIRRYLTAVRRQLAAGRNCGAGTVPELRNGSYSLVQCYLALNMDGHERELLLSLWANYCSCSTARYRPPCAHLIFCRAVWRTRVCLSVGPMWRTGCISMLQACNAQ